MSKLQTYDKNMTRKLALVATVELMEARYMPLAAAPGDLSPISSNHLGQLHAVANASWKGIYATQKPDFDPGEWEVFGAKKKSAA